MPSWMLSILAIDSDSSGWHTDGTAHVIETVPILQRRVEQWRATAFLLEEQKKNMEEHHAQ